MVRFSVKVSRPASGFTEKACRQAESGRGHDLESDLLNDPGAQHIIRGDNEEVFIFFQYLSETCRAIHGTPLTIVLRQQKNSVNP